MDWEQYYPIAIPEAAIQDHTSRTFFLCPPTEIGEPQTHGPYILRTKKSAQEGISTQF